MARQTTNHLDLAVSSLRSALKQIENEERELARAKQRILKALHAFVQEDGSVPLARTSPRVLGPRRYDARDVMLQNVIAHRVAGKEFTAVEAREWSPELRKGQANSALDKLVREGVLIRVKRGTFMLTPPKKNGSGNNND